MDDYEKYLRFAIRFLGRRPRSVKEVRDRLIMRQASPEVADRVIDRLSSEKFLNDAEFAGWWIRQRTEFRPKPRRVILLELSQKGIPREVAEEALGAEDTPYENDIEQAKKVGEKQIRRYRTFSRDEAREKLAVFLARRGFSWETIKRCIDEILALQYNRD